MCGGGLVMAVMLRVVGLVAVERSRPHGQSLLYELAELDGWGAEQSLVEFDS
jgi:hypothetical protein